ncbi:sugar-binding transcriptional regulator [Tissierellaceae bacterium BX21]|uniref:Sugar-binding transcriptional regulator n=1 Tax=Paratissierella segnis TaxID=2763679 RepID=A0A926IGE8_9FIRM|nr:sugar-binding transcriptional regulator [Paratissierella segnis]
MDIIKLIKSISPEFTDIVEGRYLILRGIYYNQPIGRRTLSQKLEMPERYIRNEINILKELSLVTVDSQGMSVTKEGYRLVEDFNEVYVILKGMPELEKKLEEALKIKDVIIVPGNSQKNGLVLREMGKIISAKLKDIIKPKDIIGITGGSTMATVADEMTPSNKPYDVTVIPARGGLGKEVETQSNSIAAKISQKLGGNYRLLYVPDSLEKEALEMIAKNGEIKEAIELIDNMTILLFGLGRADIMANRRNLPKEKIDGLLKNGAVAEAFGHYFDIEGNEIWEYKTIGIRLNKYKEMEHIIGVAGGEEKAEAIIAISHLSSKMTLVTDESAAKKILEIINNKLTKN